MSKIIRLNRNENPYPPLEKIIEAAKKGLTNLNRYPDTEDIDNLRRMLSVYTNVKENQVFLGSGFDSLIMQIINLFSRKGKIVTVDPTLSFPTRTMYDLETKLLKIKICEPLFSLPITPLINELKDADLVFIDNPNNPTGSLLLDGGSVDDLCNSTDGVVLIDEAYYEFSHFSVVDMVNDHGNLAVIRTMSKAFGLAGLRIGYMIAGETVAKKFSNKTLPFTLSKPSVYAAIEALKDTDYMSENVELILKERERVREEASQIGVKAYQSNTNFLLMRTSIPYISRKLREFGIMVADLSGHLPPEFIRVSIGTREENDALLDALRKLVESNC